MTTTTRRARPAAPTPAQRAYTADALALAEGALATLALIERELLPPDPSSYGARMALFAAKGSIGYLISRLEEGIGG